MSYIASDRTGLSLPIKTAFTIENGIEAVGVVAKSAETITLVSTTT